MIAVLLWIVLGVVLGIGGLFAYGMIADSLDHRRRLIRAAELQRQHSEARIQQITQDAVQQMLNIARSNSR